MDITIQMRTLVEELNRASDAYYNGRGELMTDYEWDAKFDQLKQLESQSGVVLPDSPTHRVSADTTVGKKEEHEFSALSLAKTKQPTDLVKWAEGRPIWLSWKLDGLTLVVTYDEGQLTKVVTRGDGHIGTNITHLAQAINGIPATIHATGHVVVRGEAVISYEDFDRFNLESDEEYANPRNLASGSLTLKDPREVAQRHIRWIPFTLVHTDEEIPTWGARMDWLKKAGLGAVDHERIDDPTLEHMEAAIERWTEKVTKRENPYPVDGLVIVYDDAEYAATGSVTGHHATRAGYAFKWADESASTELDHVEWSCAASTISPVAVFRPVELEGTTVKRASLCNISECERLGMGGKGTQLEVIKANKIIPKVIKVKQAVGPFCIPDRCPVCGSPTRVDVSAASGTKTLHCTHAACPAKQLRKFARFVSKQGVNVDGISEQTLQKFINLGWIRDYADIFDLPTHAMEIAALEGFGVKSATNIRQSVERARKVEARRLLYALSIPLCGQDVCNRLLSAYSLNDLIALAEGNVRPTDLFTPSAEETLAMIPGIGPEKAKSFVAWFAQEEHRAVMARLLNVLTVEQTSTAATGEKCKGLVFVVTGDVHHYKNRNELKAYIESQGGKVTGSVSKSTSYLINNDVTSTSSKNQKAHQFNIPIISEDEFVERFG
ncbi:NAD-dependent DNA ligase LigA [Hallella sp.]|uniref:NAD-dependent DNA ligase LigA n=1 Tax=Hallella sp. TaxID=2980186 RepID=UPI002848A585|nr:NAD-dependent DNA ligase LigA [Hallella sp.]MDR3843528.1 NAD-dependent DNA ligase LigA [Hallella sp.]